MMAWRNVWPDEWRPLRKCRRRSGRGKCFGPGLHVAETMDVRTVRDALDEDVRGELRGNERRVRSHYRSRPNSRRWSDVFHRHGPVTRRRLRPTHLRVLRDCRTHKSAGAEPNNRDEVVDGRSVAVNLSQLFSSYALNDNVIFIVWFLFHRDFNYRFLLRFCFRFQIIKKHLVKKGPALVHPVTQVFFIFHNTR